MTQPITLSPLGHTWLIDLDGTVMRHNAHLTGADELLPGAREFWAQIPVGDTIIILTAREEELREMTIRFLAAEGLRYNQIIFNLPTGERILINDRKPSGLTTALAVSVERDGGLQNLAINIAKDL